MLTKDTKNQAEKIRANVADILAACSLMAKVWENKEQAHAEAAALWHCWQFPDSYESNHSDTKRAEEARTAREVYKTNPRQWGQRVEELAKAKESARVALFVARVNFQNYINYCAELIAELVRPFWRGFALRKGAEDLGDILTPDYKEKDRDTSHAFRVWFKISGGNVGAQLFPSSFIRLDVHIFPRGIACGIYGEAVGVYMGGDVADIPQEKQAPHLLTVAEYVRAVKELKELKNQAETVASECAKKSRELVRSLGLYGFAEFLNSYRLDFGR